MVKTRTKEAVLKKVKELNINVNPDELHTINDIAHVKGKARSLTKPKNPNEKRGGDRNKLSTTVSDEYSAQLLEHAIKYWDVPTAKTDEEIAKRIEFYFNDCYKNKFRPTLEGCALAIGVTVETFTNWSKKESKTPFDRHDQSKRVRTLLANFDANLASNGKMTPVVYIFRSKNFYGMKDETENIIKHDTKMDGAKTADELLEIIDADVIETD